VAQLSLHHSRTLTHHIAQADAWLALSSDGMNTVPLGYAALELRYAIERLAVHYWAGLVAGTQDEAELLAIGSFNKIEARIYELAGHQRQIDRALAFAQLLCGLLGIVVPQGRPSMPTLRKHWHTCSEVCHIGWALVAPEAPVGVDTYKELRSAHADVLEMANGYNAMPRLNNPGLHALQRGYIEGTVSDDDVRSYVAREGLKAEYIPPGASAGTPIGKAIPSNSEIATMQSKLRQAGGSQASDA